MKYEFCEAGNSVYHQGDEADKCYILIKGRVQINTLESTNVTPQEQDIEEIEPAMNTLSVVSSKITSGLLRDVLQPKIPKRKTKSPADVLHF